MVGWTSRSGESPQLTTCDIYNHLSLDPRAPVLGFESFVQRANSILLALHPNSLEKNVGPPGFEVMNLVQLLKELKAIIRPAPFGKETVASREAVNEELAAIQRNGVAGWRSTWDFDANKDEQGKLDGRWTPITTYGYQFNDPLPSLASSSNQSVVPLFTEFSFRLPTSSTTPLMNLVEGVVIAQQNNHQHGKKRKITGNYMTKDVIEVCYPTRTLTTAKRPTHQRQNNTQAIQPSRNTANPKENDEIIIIDRMDDDGASYGLVIHGRNGRPLHQTHRWDRMTYATTASFRYILTLSEMEHYGRIRHPTRKGNRAEMLVVGVIRKDDDANVEFAEYQVVAHLVDQKGKLRLHYKSYDHSLTGEFALPEYGARSSSASLTDAYNTVKRLGYFLNPWSVCETEDELRDQLEFYFEHGVFSPKAIMFSDKATAGNF